MITATRETYQRAINRSRIYGGVQRVRSLGLGRYVVRGATGILYVVTVQPGADWRCTCLAGERQLVCWHTAAVWSKRLTEQMREQIEANNAKPSDCIRRARIKASLRVLPPEDDQDEAAVLYGSLATKGGK